MPPTRWMPATLFSFLVACSACGDGDADVADAAMDANADPQDAGDCASDDPTKYSIYNIDRDGDGLGDPSMSICGGSSPPEGYVSNSLYNLDCDDTDSQLGAGFYERFDDNIDSNCDGVDDPDMPVVSCSCKLRAPVDSASPFTSCAEGFEPEDAAELVAAGAVNVSQTCPNAADLSIGFAVQCGSQCSEGPVYFTVNNSGGTRSAASIVSLTGSFRAGPPSTPLQIEPLDPGASTALIEVNATGEFTLSIEAKGDCDASNNKLSVIVGDYHCGFYDN